VTLTLEGNPNYAAVIHEYDPANEVPLPNRDRIVGYKVLGYQTLVGKGAYKKGDLVVVFGAETQLSEAYATFNNLHRHEHLNADPTQKGYLEDNRRVKAIRLGGHRSDAMVMPWESLAQALGEGHVISKANAGVAFDHVNGVEISRKYVKPSTGTGRSMANRQGQKKVRVSTEHFPEHFYTPNGFRYPQHQPDDYVFVTQKLHGTSVRMGRVPVARDLKWYERLAQRLGVKVRTHEYGVVVGSRRVTKSVDGKVEGEKNHWYEGGDIWTTVTKPMHDLIPENFLVFAEIIGWTPDGAPIQPMYTYNLPEGQAAVYIYRVATVNGQGDVVDLPWRAVQKFAEARGWLTVAELDSDIFEVVEDVLPQYMDLRFSTELTVTSGSRVEEVRFPGTVPLSDPKTVDEGVVVRSDNGFTPTVAKYKSPIFLGHESAMMDRADAVDTEEEG
jgi:hypothetical protein